MPSEDSSGERRRQGAITKTGNTHARHLLVDEAWPQRRPLRAGAALERRRQGQPAAVRARADESRTIAAIVVAGTTPVMPSTAAQQKV